MQHTGIYMISCPNERKYVGQSKYITKRWRDHDTRLYRGAHENPILQNIYNKYGRSSLQYSILEICGLSELNNREEYWIETIPKDRRINISKVKHSKEYNRKNPIGMLTKGEIELRKSTVLS